MRGRQGARTDLSLSLSPCPFLGVGGAEAIPRTVPGRMKAKLDEGLVDLQGYHIANERILALAAICGETRQPALSELERRLLAYAVMELRGLHHWPAV